MNRFPPPIVRRGFPVYELPRLWQWCVSFRHQVMDDFGPQDEDAFVSRWLQLVDNGLMTWAVYRPLDGVEELGGIITVEKMNPVNGSAFFLFKRPFWGRHTSEPAAKEALRQAFEQDPEMQKITLSIFADNHQLSRLAHDLGYRREGRIRQATMRRGQAIDTLVLGLTRKDFESCLHSSPPSSEAQLELSAAS